MADPADDVFRSVRGLISERPALQHPAHDELVRKVVLPDQPGDRRFYVDITALRDLLDQAESSPTQRAVLHNVKLVVEQYRDRNGHLYEVWALEGGPVAPEMTSREASILARGT